MYFEKSNSVFSLFTRKRYYIVVVDKLVAFMEQPFFIKQNEINKKTNKFL
jgi:hypothetical protein